MTPGNQEGRRRAPEKVLQLNAIARPLYFGYRRDYWTGAELVRNAAYNQYPEAFQQPTYQQTNAQEMAQRASHEAMNTLINTVGQGAAQGAEVQTPSTWGRREEVPMDAPQGPFNQEFIQQEAAQPAPGFADLYGRQAINMSEADFRSEVDQGLDQVDAFLRQQASDRQLEDA